jgi:hypothetical protein
MANIFDQFDAPANNQKSGNVFDQFDAPMPQSKAAPQQTFGEPYYDPATGVEIGQSMVGDGQQPDTKAPTGYAEDVLKGAGSGLVKGATQLAGFPAMLEDASDFIARQTAGRLSNYARKGEFTAPTYEEGQKLRARTFPEQKTIQGAVEGVTGKLYEPQTRAGQYAGTIAEFASAAPFTAGSMLQRVAQIAIPAIVSEAGGQLTKGTAAEPYARLGGALVGGIGTAVAQRPTTAQGVLSEALGNVSDDVLQSAKGLMDRATQQGVPLTWSEAINQVSSGRYPQVRQMMQVVESSTKGGDVMNPFMAQRPSQVRAAGGRVFDEISPEALDPVRGGIAVRNASEGAIGAAQAERTAAVRPFYQAAEQDAVDPAVVQAVIAKLDDLIAQDATGDLAKAARQIRQDLIEVPAQNAIPSQRVPVNDPKTGELIRYKQTPSVAAVPEQPVTNVSKLDTVYGAARDDYLPSSQIGLSGTERRAQRQTQEALKGLNEVVSQNPNIQQGRQLYQDITKRNIEPMVEGSLGKSAKTTDIIEQGNSFFPNAPAPNQYRATGEAIQQLVKQDPKAAQTLVRSHLERVFNETTQDLATGANQAGGAKFAATIKGNAEQAKAIEEGIKSLKNGDVKLKAFNNFIEVVEATGYRMTGGSNTQARLAMKETLEKGGASGNVATAAAGGGLKVPTMIRDAYLNYRYGKNTDQIARIMTDPKAEGLLRALAKVNPKGKAAQNITARLLTLGASSDGKSQKPVK